MCEPIGKARSFMHLLGMPFEQTERFRLAHANASLAFAWVGSCSGTSLHSAFATNPIGLAGTSEPGGRSERRDALPARAIVRLPAIVRNPVGAITLRAPVHMVIPRVVIVLAGSRHRHPAEQHSTDHARRHGATIVSRMTVMVTGGPMMGRPVVRWPYSVSRPMAGRPPKIDVRDRIGD